jgi:hypothetical protein
LTIDNKIPLGKYTTVSLAKEDDKLSGENEYRCNSKRDTSILYNDKEVFTGRKLRSKKINFYEDRVKNNLMENEILDLFRKTKTIEKKSTMKTISSSLNLLKKVSPPFLSINQKRLSESIKNFQGKDVNYREVIKVLRDNNYELERFGPNGKLNPFQDLVIFHKLRDNS